MPLPFFLAALFGKAAVGAVAKGLAGKAAAFGIKAVVGHHGHHTLAQHVAKKAAESVADLGLRALFPRKKRKKERADGA